MHVRHASMLRVLTHYFAILSRTPVRLVEGAAPITFFYGRNNEDMDMLTFYVKGVSHLYTYINK